MVMGTQVPAWPNALENPQHNTRKNCTSNGRTMGLKMRLMIMGHAQHGKDTACDMLRHYHGMTFRSSSEFAAEKAVYPHLRHLYDYNSLEQCINDRNNHRPEWHQLIAAYNTPDKARLAREIYQVADIYCGLRCAQEFYAIKAAGLFQYAIWVDASARKPPEPASSITTTPAMADFILDNNGTHADLRENLRVLMWQLFRKTEGI